MAVELYSPNQLEVAELSIATSALRRDISENAALRSSRSESSDSARLLIWYERDRLVVCRCRRSTHGRNGIGSVDKFVVMVIDQGLTFTI